MYAVTDYRRLYEVDYYGHQDDATSFNKSTFPNTLLNIADSAGAEGLLDIGGGNGWLTGWWRKGGRPAMAVDYSDYERSDVLSLDLASRDDRVRGVCQSAQEKLGSGYLATCLDVAEHIDPMHMPNFLDNLWQLTQDLFLLSISTRPSSQANRFHVSIYPISTWCNILQEAGFEIISHPALDEIRNKNTWAEYSRNLAMVSHWLGLNPFRDKNNHQHYLLCRKSQRKIKSFDGFRRKICDLLDVSFIEAKRNNQNLKFIGEEDVHIRLKLHFYQDWSFIRSYLDVIPREKLSISLGTDFVPEPYFWAVESLIERHGCDYQVASQIEDEDFSRPSKYAFYLWHCDGPRHLPHLIGGLAILKARQSGWASLSLQHGMGVASFGAGPSSFNWGFWDKESLNSAKQKFGEEVHGVVLGSPKFLDAMLDIDPDAFYSRFGSWAKKFQRRVLIATNLHWHVHEKRRSQTIRWIEKTALKHPSDLFIIKPHPEDVAALNARRLWNLDNVMFVDELALLSINWPMSRLIKSVDVVCTSYSTILLDALIAGKGCVLLPYDDSELTQQLPALSEEFWSSGGIGAVSGDLEHALSGKADPDVSASFFSNLDRQLKALALKPDQQFDFQSLSEARRREISNRTSNGKKGRGKPSSDSKSNFEEWMRRFVEATPSRKPAWRRLFGGIQ